MENDDGSIIERVFAVVEPALLDNRSHLVVFLATAISHINKILSDDRVISSVPFEECCMGVREVGVGELKRDVSHLIIAFIDPKVSAAITGDSDPMAEILHPRVLEIGRSGCGSLAD